MVEEKFVDPNRLAKRLKKRAIKSRIRASGVKPSDVARRRRELRKRAEMRRLSETLPEGISPKLRASLDAAYRRHADDPEVQKKLAAAQLQRRVEMAKKESGISDKPGKPIRFMGMDEKQWENEVVASLPPPVAATRKKKERK